MKNILALSVFSILFNFCFAQMPQQGNKNTSRTQMNIGHFFGRVVDAKTKKGIEFASVQLTQSRMDTVTHQMKDEIVGGELTSGNGSFSLENLPVMGQFTLSITALGYVPYQQKISFNLNMGQGNPQQMMNKTDKDLGNIPLEQGAVKLDEITVTGEDPTYELKIDKKVYNVSKDQSVEGGTAEDVLKNVPSVSVDIDGNVSVRNSSPQIFVDGRPTTLTIDQIPADAIETVEVITNPSAKYDASGGGGGIVNIVLKKNRRMGYNGAIRSGVDSRGRINLGGDLNAREKKINIFLSGMINQRKSQTIGETERNYLLTTPGLNLFQHDTSVSKGTGGFGRGGFDWFIDNRNTLTFAATYYKGSFKPTDELTTISDTLYPSGLISTSSFRQTNGERSFQNRGGTIAFKHLYPKEGKVWSADGSYYYSTMKNSANYQTNYFDANGYNYRNPALQQQNGGGTVQTGTMQTDYTNPITDKLKLEAGARGSFKTYSSSINNYLYDAASDDYRLVPTTVSNYKYTDQVYAGYVTVTQQLKKFGFQVGLRGESSFYNGEITDNNQKFRNNYPVSLFPSVFASYSLNDNNSFQLNYSRRINRPTFFQLIPYTDYSDSLNLTRGNADLRPEFVNSIEANWQKVFDRKNNILTSLYFKNTTGLITNFQVFEYDSVVKRNAIISTYENANSSYAYGAEFTSQNSFAKWFDLSLNINAYNSFINGTNLENNLKNEQFSWFAKVISTFKLPKNFTLQISGDYRSKTSLQVGGNMQMGGRGYFGGTTTTAQGYVNPNYGADASLKYEFLKNKAASLTLSISDIFRTRVNSTYSSSDFFTQTIARYRDPQVVRLNFNYRFGKFDVSLLKRKNMLNNDMPDIGM